MATQIFYTEDTCALKDNPSMIGLVDRTYGDVDTHEPEPERDYDHPIERHSDIPKAQFKSFMKTGIPPRGTVLVAWQPVPKVELIPEANLALLDRALLVGDVVKRNPQSPTSGTIVSTTATCTLAPAALVLQHRGSRNPFFDDAAGREAIKEQILREVPAEELEPSHDYHEGTLIIYQDWVGVVEDIEDEVTIRLGNGSVVVADNPDDLDAYDVEDDRSGMRIERFSIGDQVRSKKGNLRRGRWKFGAYNPNVDPTGTVVDVRTVSIGVNWLCQGLHAPLTPGAFPSEPPMDLDVDILESGNVHIYDRTRLPKASSDTGNTPYRVHAHDLSVGHRVRFKDLSGACVKYDGSGVTSTGVPQGKLVRIPRTAMLGYDTNVFMILSMKTEVTVLWQDLTTSKHISTALIPDPNVEDEDEVWPGEIVVSKERKPKVPDDSTSQAEEDWTFEPARVGVVQSVKASDRIAQVRWFPDASVKFAGDDLLPGSQTGRAAGETEDVSLYDIRTSPGLNRRRGDIVIILGTPDAMIDVFSDRPGSFAWFGEVVDLGLDGLLTVRLGALDEVRDIRLPAECVALAYGSDDDPHLLGHDDGAMSETTDDLYDQVENESEEEEEDEDDVVLEQWVEYEGGGPLDGDSEDEAWSTESSDDEDEENDDEEEEESIRAQDEDTPMTDVEQPPSADPKVQTQPEPPIPVPLSETKRGDAPQALALSGRPNAPSPFAVLDTPPPEDHHFLSQPTDNSNQRMRRIQKEHKILSSSLPEGIFVRTWESRLDLLRVLIIGPLDTPYELAPFLIDFHLGPAFPSSPPDAYFHSWTGGYDPVNPNLYEDGKICLSLLGTWHTDSKTESWSPSRSTVLQVLVSLLGLVLVKEPYYNEAGFEVRAGTEESVRPSALYTERAYFRARGFISHALSFPVRGFEEEVKWLYLEQGEDTPRLLQRAIELAKRIIERSEEPDRPGEVRDGLRRVSAGALIPLKRQVEALEALRGLEFQR